MRYKVTVKFSRLNVKGVFENSERSGTVEAVSRDEAKKAYLKQFKANEPNRRKIYSVSVEAVR